MNYDELDAIQKKTLCRDLKKLMADMDALGVEILDLTFYLESKHATPHNTNTTQTNTQHHNEKMPAV